MPSSAGFVGCMRRWSVNKAPIKENQLFEHSVGVHIGCKRRENACATGDICGYGNQCIDRWTEFECRCRGNGVVAKGCLRGIEIFSFCLEARRLNVFFPETC